MTTYQAKEIEVLTGLEPVRQRPGMYTDTSNPNHLAREAVDNSVDERLAGFCSKIEVIHHADGSLSVIDNGRGMPADIHPKHGVSGVELIMTRLHAGAKFSGKNYRFSGGLHGVGISVTNALSTAMTVEVCQGGKQYCMTFADGNKQSELKVIGEVPKRQTGTRVHFKPDPQYFDDPNFNLKSLKRMLRAKAVLCAGLEVCFVDENKQESLSWHYENGMQAYLQGELEGVDYSPCPPFLGSHVFDESEVDWGLTWQEYGTPICESYVNLIPTSQGGTHVSGMRNGLLEAVREFCDIHDLLPRGVKLKGEDIWGQCSYVLSVKIKNPQFSGQTKERLTTRSCASWASNIVKDDFSLWLNQHISDAQTLVEQFINNAQERQRIAKKVVRKKQTQGPKLPGKLADCLSDEQETSELFLVEGDSAGGSAKQARDKDTQAILPLRGKILNSWEVDSDQVLASQTVHDIAVAIGVDPGSSDVTQCRYGKICILADADSDGSHIATLICALFYRHFKPLVVAGFLYVAMPPLYRIDAGKIVHYALDEEEKDEILKKIEQGGKAGKIVIQRFKGLGEMNPSQLRETTMAVATRRLVQLCVDEGQDFAMLDKLLAKKRSEDRKKWLETEGDIAEV